MVVSNSCTEVGLLRGFCKEKEKGEEDIKDDMVRKVDENESNMIL